MAATSDEYTIAVLGDLHLDPRDLDHSLLGLSKKAKRQRLRPAGSPDPTLTPILTLILTFALALTASLSKSTARSALAFMAIPACFPHRFLGRDHFKEIFAATDTNKFVVSLGDLGESKDCTGSGSLFAGTTECFKLAPRHVETKATAAGQH